MTLTFSGSDVRAIKFVAQGQGLAGTGNIFIGKALNLNGANGGQNGENGGARTFGSGAGGART